jgi:predicted anti-sigma-YlaC factor YlaD
MNNLGNDVGPADNSEMDCVDFLRRVDELLDVDADMWDARVRRHLVDCPPCRVFLEQLQDLRELLRAASTQDSVPPDDPRIAAIMSLSSSKEIGPK